MTDVGGSGLPGKNSYQMPRALAGATAASRPTAPTTTSGPSSSSTDVTERDFRLQKEIGAILRDLNPVAKVMTMNDIRPVPEARLHLEHPVVFQRLGDGTIARSKYAVRRQVARVEAESSSGDEEGDLHLRQHIEQQKNLRGARMLKRSLFDQLEESQLMVTFAKRGVPDPYKSGDEFALPIVAAAAATSAASSPIAKSNARKVSNSVGAPPSKQNSQPQVPAILPPIGNQARDGTMTLHSAMLRNVPGYRDAARATGDGGAVGQAPQQPPEHRPPPTPSDGAGASSASASHSPTAAAAKAKSFFFTATDGLDEPRAEDSHGCFSVPMMTLNDDGHLGRSSGGAGGGGLGRDMRLLSVPDADEPDPAAGRRRSGPRRESRNRGLIEVRRVSAGMDSGDDEDGDYSGGPPAVNSRTQQHVTTSSASKHHTATNSNLSVDAVSRLGVLHASRRRSSAAVESDTSEARHKQHEMLLQFKDVRTSRILAPDFTPPKAAADAAPGAKKSRSADAVEETASSTTGSLPSAGGAEPEQNDASKMGTAASHLHFLMRMRVSSDEFHRNTQHRLDRMHADRRSKYWKKFCALDLQRPLPFHATPAAILHHVEQIISRDERQSLREEAYERQIARYTRVAEYCVATFRHPKVFEVLEVAKGFNYKDPKPQHFFECIMPLVSSTDCLFDEVCSGLVHVATVFGVPQADAIGAIRKKAAGFIFNRAQQLSDSLVVPDDSGSALPGPATEKKAALRRNLPQPLHQQHLQQQQQQSGSFLDRKLSGAALTASQSAVFNPSSVTSKRGRSFQVPPALEASLQQDESVVLPGS